MNTFRVRYQDRSYVVWLRETMGPGAERQPEEWVIVSGDKMVAAIPYIESESLEQVEARVLSALSTRIK